MMNEQFRFGIMGAGNIAGRFCEAVIEQGDGIVTAIASRSIERANRFAENYNIANAYGSYEEMLQKEHLDAVYIAVTTNAHFELTMLCLDYSIPVLCEKAMCRNSTEAQLIFERAKEQSVFVMEGMWSRFLPKMQQVKSWLNENQIGDVALVTCSVGFQAQKTAGNRYYNPQLGGGAAYDLLVYCYEITADFFDQPPIQCQCMSDWSESGVDRTDLVMMKYPGCLVQLTATFEGNIPEEMVFYGSKGKIVIPKPHCAQECLLYVNGQEPIRYEDTDTQNGFIYEIKEVIRCVRNKQIESPVVPHRLTYDTAVLFDRILEQKP